MLDNLSNIFTRHTANFLHIVESGTSGKAVPIDLSITHLAIHLEKNQYL